ncbi:MAG: glycosyltransferase family 9 protein [candidate division Zixibacteria bacterium]
MKKPILKRLEHGFKRMLFWVSRLYLKKGRKDFTSINPLEIKKVLFLRPEKLGDMVISLPVFYNLKNLYPHLKLFTICSPRNIAVVKNSAHIEKNFLYTKNFFRDLKVLGKVRSLKVDAVVDMICDDSVTALFLSQYSSPGAWRIGVGKTRHREYYDFNYKYRTGDEAHVVDNTIKLLTAFGIETDDLEKHVPPTIDEKCFEVAERFIKSIQDGTGDKLVGLNISAGRATRVWPVEKNIELVNRFLDNHEGFRVVISSDPTERKRAETLASKFDSRVYTFPEGLNLLEVSAIISRLELLVTPDTSLVHIARAFRIPVVGLYTRFDKNFKLWKPYNQDGGAVVSNNNYNIFDIEVDDVYNEVSKLLKAEVSR